MRISSIAIVKFVGFRCLQARYYLYCFMLCDSYAASAPKKLGISGSRGTLRS